MAVFRACRLGERQGGARAQIDKRYVITRFPPRPRPGRARPGRVLARGLPIAAPPCKRRASGL